MRFKRPKPPSVRPLFVPAWLRLNTGWPGTGCPELPRRCVSSAAIVWIPKLPGVPAYTITGLSGKQDPSLRFLAKGYTGVEPVSAAWQAAVLAIGLIPHAYRPNIAACTAGSVL